MKAAAGEVKPPQDYAFMFSGSFADPDGHVWEALRMDPSFVQKS